MESGNSLTIRKFSHMKKYKIVNKVYGDGSNVYYVYSRTGFVFWERRRDFKTLEHCEQWIKEEEGYCLAEKVIKKTVVKYL